MAYRCGQAIIGRADEPIRCKVSGGICAHQRMCMMEGRIVLTDQALSCPARDGRLPEEPAKTTAEAPAVKVRKTAEKAPAKKPAATRRKAK